MSVLDPPSVEAETHRKRCGFLLFFFDAETSVVAEIFKGLTGRSRSQSRVIIDMLPFQVYIRTHTKGMKEANNYSLLL